MISKTIARITFEQYAFGAIEYRIDGEAVSYAGPLNGTEAEQVPFHVEMPVIRPLAIEGPAETRTSEHWVSHEVIDHFTGVTCYASNASDADSLAYAIAESHLLRALIRAGKLE
jgi:hypothetical protein